MAVLAITVGCESVSGPGEEPNPTGRVVAWFNGLGSTVDLYFPDADSLIIQAYNTGNAPNDIAYLGNDLIGVVNSITGTLSVYDLSSTGGAYVEVDLGTGSNPYCLDSDQSSVYVTLLLAGEVAVVDMSSWSVEETFDVSPNPSGIAVVDGELFVSHANWPDTSFTGGVTVVNASTGATLDTVAAPTNTVTIRYFPETGRLHASATTYVGDGTISIIDPQSRSVIATVPTGGSPTVPAMLGSGRFAAGDGWSSNSVYLYGEDGTVSSTWDCGHNVTGVASFGSDTLYMTGFNGDKLYVGLASSQTIVDSLDTGDAPQGIICIDRPSGTGE
jgi:YVTN family beta-propeller protein